MLTEKFDKEEYNITEKFMTSKKAGLLLTAFLLPLYTAETVIYLFQRDYANIFATFFKSTFLLEIFILAIGVFLFLALSMIAKAFFLTVFSEGKSQSLKFKMIKETQRPYCCLTEPIKIWQYQICLAVCILIVGIVPYVLSLIVGDFIFVLASFACAFFAGNDFLFFVFLLRQKNDAYVLDFEGIMMYRIYNRKDKP